MGWTPGRETSPESLRTVFTPRWGTGGGQPSLPLRAPPPRKFLQDHLSFPQEARPDLRLPAPVAWPGCLQSRSLSGLVV